MPDKRRHRGPDPEDERLFGSPAWAGLRAATDDLCWLLDRGYAITSALELVGNRYSLAARQRLAVRRCAASSDAVRRRQERLVGVEALAGSELWLDAYNILIALEAALSGGIILRARDGCYRDLANIYARYREVEETIPALRLIAEMTASWGVRECRWLIDRPVSNSGRFGGVLLDVADKARVNWQVELAFNPDKLLAESPHIVATSDSVVLDRCARWCNLGRWIIERAISQAWVVDLEQPRTPAG